jgi:hypothetical protein
MKSSTADEAIPSASGVLRLSGIVFGIQILPLHFCQSLRSRKRRQPGGCRQDAGVLRDAAQDLSYLFEDGLA